MLYPEAASLRTDVSSRRIEATPRIPVLFGNAVLLSVASAPARHSPSYVSRHESDRRFHHVDSHLDLFVISRRVQ